VVKCEAVHNEGRGDKAMTTTNTTLLHGDCLTVLPTLPANSVDSIVTDPPYGLSFMGKDWDHGVPGAHFWVEALRVSKPGAHLLAFGGTRTFHRLAVAIEDAGWEIRDCVMWVYGSGFPKSLDVSKAIDKAAGAEREIVGEHDFGSSSLGNQSNAEQGYRSRVYTEGLHQITAPATDAAREWDGWGTALKPAWEPIIVARKPLEGTVAANVLKWGTGAINVYGCRVETNGERPTGSGNPCKTKDSSAIQPGRSGGNGGNSTPPEGRWPANIIHDGSQLVLDLFPVTGASKAAPRGSVQRYDPSDLDAKRPKGGNGVRGYDDAGGSAARFFYCAKASKADRDDGLEGFDLRPSYMVENGSNTAAAANGVRYDRTTMQRNHHPTVKPTSLMRYLCRLVTPPHGTILDPFMGSGSTGKAAALEHFHFIGIDKEQEYLPIAQARNANAHQQADGLL
jgi:DNA modification methylase